MGNQQTYEYTFGYDDADSGFSEQSSPFELNRSNLFNELNSSNDAESLGTSIHVETSMSLPTPRQASTPKAINPGNSTDKETAPNNQRRRSSIVKSKTIEISRSITSLAREQEEERDSFNENFSEEFNSNNKSNISMISVSL